ncbi:3-hydroxybenzoate 6-hydroxylase 1 [Roseivivax jejudonensis]|uniref:3-hydroxybenzoate 6-hydroxylase 1 n=1 Tax=Roseivivax jejudonensis TaxID=1529041 RepID=A0A1X6ZWT4_9RHOB|nr:FAD-dependent monooxygenase [Roseivivax jejudonensis]SLN63772.1 3-hydroxybenzoate 6-hydroxylase 1 [Roseivivax jejudonensis]
MTHAHQTDTPDLVTDAIVIGGGIGGLTAALFLERHGIPAEVFERSAAINELGVGINLMPQAIATWAEIGLLDDIEAAGIAPDHLYYRTKSGATAWDEPRGRAAGLPYPQVSIHRGRLQGVLHRAYEARRPGHVHCDRKFVGYEEREECVIATFEARDGSRYTVEGQVLIGADGIHSALRARLYRDEGRPRWSGRIMWRGTADWPAFGDGRSFVIAGDIDTRLVLFPIGAGESPDTRLTNWVLVHRMAEDGAAWEGTQDWQNRADRDQCLAAVRSFDLPDLDVSALVAATGDILEYPMSDRDPLEAWSFGRVTLLGDAAHPMYPFGGNGSAQAALDARALAEALSHAPDPVQALRVYEEARRERVYEVVLTNRKGGPERVIDVVEERMRRDGVAPEDIPVEERREIVHAYAKLAGYAKDQLERRAS